MSDLSEGYVVRIGPGLSFGGDGATAHLNTAWMATIYQEHSSPDKWPTRKHRLITLVGDSELDAIEQLRLFALAGHATEPLS